MEPHAFGRHIREKRLARLADNPAFSLRRLAARLGIQASYLSRLERGAPPSLSEAHIVALAGELGESPEILLALAGKLPTDVRDAVLAKPDVFAPLIRELAALPDAELRSWRDARFWCASFAESQRLARVGNFSRDLTTGQDFWSEEFFRIFGLPPDGPEPTYEGVLALIHPDDRPLVADVRQRLLAGQGPLRYAYRFRRGDGLWRHAKAVARAATDAAGRVVRVHGTVQDVTAERQALDNLRSMARFPEDNPHPVLRIGRDGTLAYANPASAALLDGLGLGLGASVPEPLAAVVARATASRENQRITLPLANAVMELTCCPLAGGAGVNCYGRDVTPPTGPTPPGRGRPDARATGVTDEERLKTHLRNFPLPTLTFVLRDRELVLIDANKAAEALFRGRIGSCHEAPAGAIFDESPDVYLTLWSAFEARRTERKRLRFRPPGTSEPGLFDMTFVFAAPDTVMLHAEDVTELVRARENARQTLAQLRAILDHVPYAASLVGTDGSTLFLNKAFTNLVGYTEADVPDAEAWMRRAYPDPDLRASVAADWAGALGRPSQRVYPVRCGDGRTRLLDFTVVPLPDGRMLLTMRETGESPAGP